MDTVWLVLVTDEHTRNVVEVCATGAVADRVVAELHEREDHALDLERYPDGSALCLGATCGITVSPAQVAE